MNILNLYSGIGGNRKLWNGDIKITAVEHDIDIAVAYLEFFPRDNLFLGDAHKYLLEHYDEFDFIWSSPPCPTHSKMAKSCCKGNGIINYPDMRLYQEIIFLQHYFKGKWVVENVVSYYDPLILPSATINRHYFWSNFEIPLTDIKHKTKGLFNGRGNEVKKFQDVLGIDLSNSYLPGINKKRQVLRNCVQPEIGKYIFELIS